MSKVIFDISIVSGWLHDGFQPRPEEPLGDGGQRLHQWAFGEDERNRQLMTDAVGELGAVIAGRATYETSVP
jgi:hypothetical protein